MCGICGIFNVGTREPVAGSLLKDMADTLVHRGPDDEGFFFDGPVGLAHRRLSIIDVEGGHQPLCNEDQSIWVAFNGEIYNFQELREFLEKKGHVFKTRSDTEVIVHLYEEQGEACFRSLRGMFAVAIWDRPKQSVILARDRVGKKPLFYSFDGDQLAFGSEIKALLAIPRIKREIDLEALSDYFSLLYVPAPKSIFRSIRKVRAGHYVVVSPKGLRESEYWDIDFSQPEEQSEARWCDQIVQVLREAVQLRLISEVPLGAFLSGGIDSSSVVALMSQITGGGVVTASMGFREKAFDEIEYAREVAQQYNTQHFEEIVNPDAVGIAEKLAWFFDEPFADSSAIPTYYVSKLAREHVTVALSGDGGDEFFCGYRRYMFDHREEQIRGCLPASIRALLFGTLASFYPKADWAPRIFRGKATFQNLARAHIDGYFRSVSAVSPEIKQTLLHPDIWKELGGYDTADVFRTYYDKAVGANPMARIQYVDVKTYLTDDILVKVDRASMAHSLEVRAPMLDSQFMELAAKIPTSLKLKGTSGKDILKNAFSPLLSDNILHRKKMGFGVPIAQWFRKDLKEMAHDIIFSNESGDWLDRKAVRKSWDQHQSGLRDRSTELWAIFMLNLWKRQFGV